MSESAVPQWIIEKSEAWSRTIVVFMLLIIIGATWNYFWEYDIMSTANVVGRFDRLSRVGLILGALAVTAFEFVIRYDPILSREWRKFAYPILVADLITDVPSVAVKTWPGWWTDAMWDHSPEMLAFYAGITMVTALFASHGAQYVLAKSTFVLLANVGYLPQTVGFVLKAVIVDLLWGMVKPMVGDGSGTKGGWLKPVLVGTAIVVLLVGAVMAMSAGSSLVPSGRSQVQQTVGGAK